MINGLESRRDDGVSSDNEGVSGDHDKEWTPQWTPVDQKTEGSNKQNQSTDLDEIIDLWRTL